MTAQIATAETRTEDWDWADSLLDGSDWWDLVEFRIDESEFIPETGNHVYQLDTGDCIIVTPQGDVLLGDSQDGRDV